MDNQIQLTKEQTCILFRDKTEIWIDKENEPKVSALIAESSGLVKINGKLRNKHEIKGIYSAKEMEDIYKTGKGLI